TCPPGPGRTGQPPGERTTGDRVPARDDAVRTHQSGLAGTVPAGRVPPARRPVRRAPRRAGTTGPRPVQPGRRTGRAAPPPPGRPSGQRGPAPVGARPGVRPARRRPATAATAARGSGGLVRTGVWGRPRSLIPPWPVRRAGARGAP